MSQVPDLTQLPISVSFARSSGPGGQNVNKVNSKAVLCYDLDGCPVLRPEVKERLRRLFPNRVTQEGTVVIASDSFRDQGANLKACYDKLGEMIAAASRRPKTRVATKPTRGSKERRLGEKRTRATHKENRRKVDY